MSLSDPCAPVPPTDLHVMPMTELNPPSPINWTDQTPPIRKRHPCSIIPDHMTDPDHLLPHTLHQLAQSPQTSSPILDSVKLIVSHYGSVSYY